jgi:hypothetical protein
MMRLAIDSLIALLLVGVLGLVLADYRAGAEKLERTRAVHLALARLSEQACGHAAIPRPGASVQDTPVFPPIISPAWFRSDLPLNALAVKAPWLDVAPAGDQSDNPPDPVLTSSAQAGFWYNPSRGVVRARVPAQRGGPDTLELYNQINNCALKVLPPSGDVARRPLPWQVLAAAGPGRRTP